MERKKGRLEGLTKNGQIVCNYSKQLLYLYNLMNTVIDDLASDNKNTIKIGVPPVVITVMPKTFN